MLQPNQFQINEAWVAFKLNDQPIRTDADGDFDFIALMDSASGQILSSAAVSIRTGQSPDQAAKRLLNEAGAIAKTLPSTLFMQSDLAVPWLTLDAQTQGITVVPITIDQLLLFIGDARQGFRERFGAG